MNKVKLFPLTGAIIGVIIGTIVIFILGNRTGFLFNETLLNMAIIGACVGASIGVIADMINRSNIFTNSVIYGACIGAIVDPKFSEPIPRAIAGAIAGIIAGVLYNKIAKVTKINAFVIIIFGMVIGAIYGIMIIVANGIYDVKYHSYIIIGNGVSINDFITNEIYGNLPIGMFLGAIVGSFFGAVFAIIQMETGSKGMIGGAIVGSIIIGEIFQSFLFVILGVFIGATIGAIGSKGKMRRIVTGAGVGASIGALLNEIGRFVTVPLSINIIFILPTFLIIGYYAGKMLSIEKKICRSLDI